MKSDVWWNPLNRRTVRRIARVRGADDFVEGAPCTVQELLSNGRKRLASTYDDRHALQLAEAIVMDCLGIGRAQLYASLHEGVGRPECERASNMILRLEEGEPLQYVSGWTGFYGLRIEVDDSVLIPRPETELLVERVITLALDNGCPRILDIGTGSGCISIALKKNLPHAIVKAVDISDLALRVAKHNADVNLVQITFKNFDVHSTDYLPLGGPFDFIVSNPPYIPRDEIRDLDRLVIDNEPLVALDAGEDPLSFYKSIVRLAQSQLSDVGTVVVELHPPVATRVRRLFEEEGFAILRLDLDLSRRPRILTAQKNA